jgi:hypothetical protein
VVEKNISINKSFPILRAPFESNSWLDMSSMSFKDILKECNVFYDWARWDKVLEKYKNNVLKPINLYVDNFGVKPEIQIVSKNEVNLIYKNYSDILWQYHPTDNEKVSSIFYASEKAMVRQFYPSFLSIKNFKDLIEEKHLKEASERIFKLYVPWIIDEDVEYSIKNIQNEPVIFIIESRGAFQKTNNNDIIKEPNFIDFCFLSNEKQIRLIERNTPLFYISIKATEKVIQKIINE